MERIGEGGQGQVLRVHDHEYNDDIALKTLNQISATGIRNLKQEFRAISGMELPGFIKFYELFADHSPPFFTMELLQGTPLLSSTQDPQNTLQHFAQIAHSLDALHQHRRIHRDLKPSNILVIQGNNGQPDRTIILDMGLTRSTDLGDHTDKIQGTPLYMAPEQLRGDVQPAADWYSYGVMLFEAFTGQLPFDGFDAFYQKLSSPAPRTSTLADVPPLLDDLIASLLDADPTQRPSFEQLQSTFVSLGAPTPPRYTLPPPTNLFVGREAELERLKTVQAQPGTRTIFLKGQSGIGKSSLVSQFLSQLTADPNRPLMVLKSRCHPDEHAAFKAMDPLMEQLVQTLLPRVPSELLPNNAHAIPLLFPVFQRVLRSGPSTPLPISPEGRAAAAALALRDFFRRLTTRFELFLWVDDAQWADLDSINLFQDLVGSRAPLSLLVSFRSEDQTTSPAIQKLNSLTPTETIEVSPLPPEACLQLADLLHLEPDQIASAHGSPLLINQLALHPDKAIGNGDIFQSRLRTLPPEQFELLAYCSLATRPLPRSIASHVSKTNLRRNISELLTHRLIRLQSDRPDAFVLEVYHARLRETMRNELDASTQARMHHQLFSAFASLEGIDPQTLLAHCVGAGMSEAGRYAFQAAEQASGVLAFETAAHLYGVAIQLGHNTSETHEKHAESWKNAGKLLLAAQAFETLARQTPTPSQHFLHLAAEQYLHAGKPAEGLVLLKQSLGAAQVAFPGRDGWALLKAMLLRLWFFVRGYPKPLSSKLPAQELQRADTLWAASTALAMINPIVSDFFGTQHLLHAIRLRDPSRLCRAIGYEASFEAAFGGRMEVRSRRLVDEALRLAEQTGTVEDLAWASLCACSTFTLLGDFRRAVEHGTRAEQLYREECHGRDWELAVIDMHLLSALVYLGEMTELSRRVRLAQTKTLKRGDIFARNAWRLGQPSLAWLAMAMPERALGYAQEAIAEWPTEAGFHTQDLQYMVSVASVYLYQGDGGAAWQVVEKRWGELVKAHYLSFQFARTEVQFVRGRALLAMVFANPEKTAGMFPLLEEIIKSIATWERGYAQAFAWMLRASKLAFENKPSEAGERLGEALEALEREGLLLYRDVCQDRIFRLKKEPGETLLRAMLYKDLQARGVREPERMISALLPWPGVALPAQTASQAVLTQLVSEP